MDDREQLQRQMLIETVRKLVAACHDGARGYEGAVTTSRRHRPSAGTGDGPL
jgi:hypothetical protein